jgi:hypothetical protein
MSGPRWRANRRYYSYRRRQILPWVFHPPTRNGSHLEALQQRENGHETLDGSTHGPRRRRIWPPTDPRVLRARVIGLGNRLLIFVKVGRDGRNLINLSSVAALCARA